MGVPWNPETEDGELRQHVADGLTAKQTGEIMGRSEKCILRRARGMGLKWMSVGRRKGVPFHQMTTRERPKSERRVRAATPGSLMYERETLCAQQRRERDFIRAVYQEGLRVFGR